MPWKLLVCFLTDHWSAVFQKKILGSNLKQKQQIVYCLFLGYIRQPHIKRIITVLFQKCRRNYLCIWYNESIKPIIIENLEKYHKWSIKRQQSSLNANRKQNRLGILKISHYSLSRKSKTINENTLLLRNISPSKY